MISANALLPVDSCKPANARIIGTPAFSNACI
jgi:hypothetical protein